MSVAMHYAKAKSAAKTVTAKGPRLEDLVLSTMRKTAEVVGATLGPGGSAVLIERQEQGLAPIVTKDGVTVFRSLGFQDPTSQVVLEAARDAAVRTASEAGDGTTTATILADAIVRYSSSFVKSHPKFSPQKVVRRLETLFRHTLEPRIKGLARSLPDDEAEAKKILLSVAKTSANGDAELAAKVLECFDLVGDDGNVTIAEISGPSGYEVEPIDGYAVSSGYEDSCGKYFPQFINDPGNQRCFMEKPCFLLYFGRITDIQTLAPLLENIAAMWQQNGFHHNIVVVATGFSDSVLAQLGINFAHPSTINVYPVLAPQSPQANGQLEFLQDLAAITGATIFDPMTNPLPQSNPAKLFGGEDPKTGEPIEPGLGFGSGLVSFEAQRFRCTIVGRSDEEKVLVRADTLQRQIIGAVSELDRVLLQERVGKLTGGIARLKVIGSSNGELKEKRDRAEDAVCAVRGAIKHGCLPGGGWTFLKLCDELGTNADPVIQDVLIPALNEPVNRLLANIGLNAEERDAKLEPVIKGLEYGSDVIYDALEDRHISAFEAGVLDSTSAVLEALRNSLSIASLLGTLGGAVVFGRDEEIDRMEAREIDSFLQDAQSENPANDRA